MTSSEPQFSTAAAGSSAASLSGSPDPSNVACRSRLSLCCWWLLWTLVSFCFPHPLDWYVFTDFVNFTNLLIRQSFGSCIHEGPPMDKMKSIITFQLNSLKSKSAYLNFNMEEVLFHHQFSKKCNLYDLYVVIMIRSILSLRRGLIILNHGKRKLSLLSVGIFLPVKSIAKCLWIHYT